MVTTMTEMYDAIVVGARCAGAPTGMLLARKGYKVLVVDRATFPSDTLSTHMIHAPGVAALKRWGLLDEVIATGCPPVDTYSFNFGMFTIAGSPRPSDGNALGYAPRRTLIDKILVDAASAAGAEVREGFTVEDVIVEDGIVVEQYNEKPNLQWSYYTYWSGLPVDAFETHIHPDRGWALLPTNDDLTLLVLGWPYAEANAYKADVEANYLKTLELTPTVAERVRGAKRVERFYGGSVPNFFRKPYGPGWGLIGDAGYNKDPITAQGMSDAFRDAEAYTAALDDVFTGVRSYDDAMADYHHARDEHAMPIFEFTTQLATLEVPPPDVQQVLFAVSQSAAAQDAFVSMVAGTMSPIEFFDPAHIGPIMGAAAAPAH